jgi:hypothetical protein
MNKPTLRGMALLLCVVSLALHHSVESAGALDPAWSHGWQAQSPDTHGEEDHFVPILLQAEYQLDPNDFARPVTYPGGHSLSIIPQLPPPKSI